jgi:hypothetical protein
MVLGTDEIAMFLFLNLVCFLSDHLRFFCTLVTHLKIIILLSLLVVELRTAKTGYVQLTFLKRSFAKLALPGCSLSVTSDKLILLEVSLLVCFFKETFAYAEKGVFGCRLYIMTY